MLVTSEHIRGHLRHKALLDKNKINNVGFMLCNRELVALVNLL
jgi:hypothetical protein